MHVAPQISGGGTRSGTMGGTRDVTWGVLRVVLQWSLSVSYLISSKRLLFKNIAQAIFPELDTNITKMS